MLKIKLFFVVIMMFFVVSCGGKGPDFSQVKQSDIQWSYLKSPATGKCYEVMSYQVTSAYSPATYSGMALVDDKFCK